VILPPLVFPDGVAIVVTFSNVRNYGCIQEISLQ
jgi:hypothetical protein